MQRKKISLLFVMLICGISTTALLFFYTVPNETKKIVGISQSEYLNIVYLNSHPKFDYLNGLWLDFACILFISILLYADVPDFIDVSIKYIKKWKNN